MVALALAFSAGALLCIALADLLPEIQFHDHDRGALSVLLIGGVMTAYAAAKIEHAGHNHGGHHDHDKDHPEKGDSEQRHDRALDHLHDHKD